MSKHRDESQFDGYRRDRKRWHLESGPKRDFGKRSGVLRELEMAEAAEIRNEQISREVHEFFSEATRTAAEIVERVSEAQESQLLETVSGDMLEFLNDAVRRAQMLIQQLAMRRGPNSAMVTDVEANLHNIVGPQLDGFRYEGTARVGDKHIGEDPFAVALPEPTSSSARSPHDDDPPQREQAHAPVEIEQHLVAEYDHDEAEDEAAAIGTFDTWIASLRDHPKQLAATLKVLVAGAVMPKADALAIFHELTAAPVADRR